MKRGIVIILSLLWLVSCADRKICNVLDDVESYIMERPDSALAVLEAIDREELTTDHSRAHHALLHAMALDKNWIDVTDDSLALVAVNYYRSHEPRRNYARSLYYLGKCYYYAHEYDKAILELSKAESIAAECDSLYLGMIKNTQARVYNLTYNSIEELKCIREAVDIFHQLKMSSYERPAKYYLGIAYHNTDNFDEAVCVFDELIKETTSIDYFQIHSTIQMAVSMLELNDPDFYAIDNLFSKAKNEFNAEFAERESWAWAYALHVIGKHREADEIIGNIEISNEILANFWKMRIARLQEDYESYCNLSPLVYKQQDEIVEKVLEESLAMYQRDYYQAQMKNAEYEVEIRNVEMIAMGTGVCFLLFIIFIAVRIYIGKQKSERLKLLEYAEEIKRQLHEAEKNDYSALKRKYLSLYRSRFETIGTLFDQYMQANGRTDHESIIFRKVESLIKEINNDSANRLAFEAMLDEDLDMIMTRLRKEMPKFKEIDYSIFSYLIVGFDATTISRLVDMSVSNVYTHKHRIRLRIEEKNPEHASQFLDIFN